MFRRLQKIDIYGNAVGICAVYFLTKICFNNYVKQHYEIKFLSFSIAISLAQCISAYPGPLIVASLLLPKIMGHEISKFNIFRAWNVYSP